MKLPELVQTWGTEAFEGALKASLEAMDGKTLQLQKGLERSSVASDEDIKVIMLGSREFDGDIESKVGIFYSGFIAGCACDDDPTPQEAIPEYCELNVRIAKFDGAVAISIWQDD